MFLIVEAEENREGRTGLMMMLMMMMGVGDSQDDYQSRAEFYRTEQKVSTHFYQLGVLFCSSVFFWLFMVEIE
jgi:hypothetical protein